MIFTEGDYTIINEYERGAGDMTPVVERAYINLCAAFALGCEPPGAVTVSWWNEKLLEWFDTQNLGTERCEVG